MDKDKRRAEWRIPKNIEDVLNLTQLATLGHIGRFGWELRFVRTPQHQEAVPVVFSGEDQIGILEEDGRLNLQPDIAYRESA
jgi:hypothetical protein